MSLIPVSDSIRKSQENAASAISFVRGHKIADAFFKVGEASCKSLYEKGMVAGLLANFAKVMDSAEGQGLTTSQDFGPYVMEVWPLVTAWYPDFPLKDLISVQHMDKPLAYLFFSLLKTGTAKSETNVGDVVETPLGLRTIRGKYPTGEIVGEEVLDTQISASEGTVLAYYPLNVSTIPGYVEKTRVIIGANRYQATQVVDGFILFKDSLGVDVVKSDLYIEVATGILAGDLITSLSGQLGTTVARVNYVWNLDYATTENIQRVKEQVELRPMEATPRALLLEWTLFSEYLKKAQFGQDIREENTKRILNLLYQYQIRYILDELFDGAAGASQTVSVALDTTYSLEVQSANVLKELNLIANKIELASGRIEGNRIVCGFNFKSYLEALPANLFKPAAPNTAFSGPRHIGTYGKFEVYYDPFRAADEGFMTYRGTEWYDGVYYLGEFMPIVPTDAIALGVTVKESFVSMEAYRYDKPSCVFPITFTLS